MADPPGLRLPFPCLEAIKRQELGFQSFCLGICNSFKIVRKEVAAC